MLNDCLNVFACFVFNIIDFVLFEKKIIIIDLNFCDKINFLCFLFRRVIIKKRQFKIFMFKKCDFIFESIRIVLKF